MTEPEAIPARVTLFLPSISGGGVERVMLLLASAMASRGVLVDLLLIKAKADYRFVAPPNVRVVCFGRRRVITCLPDLIRYFRKAKPAFVVAAQNHANVMALIARRLAGHPRRLVITEHSSLSETVEFTPTRTVRILRALMRRSYRWADLIVTVSAGVADDLAEQLGLPRTAMRVIYNPAITESILADALQPLDHPWFAEGEPPVVLGVGRLSEAKDFSTLLRAFAILRRTHRARLIILGQGEQRTRLVELANELGLGSDDIAFPGFVQNPYVFMRNAAVLALSSKWEGFGNVLAEAMAVGTQVVSTDCRSGPAEILENGRWGRLVPVGDPEAMAAAIRQTLDEPGIDPTPRGMFFTADRAATEYLDALRQ